MPTKTFEYDLYADCIVKKGASIGGVTCTLRVSVSTDIRVHRSVDIRIYGDKQPKVQVSLQYHAFYYRKAELGGAYDTSGEIALTPKVKVISSATTAGRVNFKIEFVYRSGREEHHASSRIFSNSQSHHLG